MPDEIRHGLSGRRAEGVLGGLGRLEEHVAMAIAVELARGISGDLHVVTLFEVCLRDGLDGTSPRLLAGHHLCLGHHRRSSLWRTVGNRRVVQEDSRLAILVALVAEGVLDLDVVAGGRTCEGIRAHRDRHVAVQIHLVVVEDDILPALAIVDRKAAVLRVAIGERLVADKIGHGRIGLGTERMLRRLGRLEKHVAMAIPVKLGCRGAGSGDKIATVAVYLRDGLDRAGPARLKGSDLIESERRVRPLRRRRERGGSIRSLGHRR